MKAFPLIVAGCLLGAAPLAQACDPMHCPSHGGVSFQEMDKNGDGAVSKKEFDAFYNARFKELDANRDGKISADEMGAVDRNKMGKSDVNFEHRFDEVDINGDGVLSRDEAEIGMPMIFARFDEFDTNKDGKISKDEMATGMKKMHENMQEKCREGMMKPGQK